MSKPTMKQAMTLTAMQQALVALEQFHPSQRTVSIAKATLNLRSAITHYEREISTDPIQAAVNRFLCWRLPADFYPDCYVTFQHPGGNASWPIGTNLLSGQQARDMLEHVLGGKDA